MSGVSVTRCDAQIAKCQVVDSGHLIAALRSCRLNSGHLYITPSIISGTEGLVKTTVET
jgi:hypothetical protein